MPGFIHTKRDEAKWSRMKHAVSHSKGKPESDFTDRDWALANYLWHKSEGELDKAEEIKKQFGGMMQLSEGQKKPSIEKLKGFLAKRKAK